MIFQSAVKQTALLELYTSEGCSSCPPAEEWLSRLKESSGLWKEFVPVAFHVDYWDNLGWRDPWGNKQFSERQRSYARSWHGERVYTPEFVLDGKEWRGWATMRNASPRSRGLETGALQVSSTDLKHWQVDFTPVARGEAGYEVHGALLVNTVVSNVKAGENQGRLLRHDFVASVLVQTRLTAQGDKAHGEFVLNPAPDGKENNRRLAVAVWVTSLGRLEPLQAIGGWLPAKAPPG